MTQAKPKTGAQELMTPAEVGRLFGVTPKTASRWADEGHLDSVKTLGGNRRFRTEQVHELYGAFMRESTDSAGFGERRRVRSQRVGYPKE